MRQAATCHERKLAVAVCLMSGASEAHDNIFGQHYWILNVRHKVTAIRDLKSLLGDIVPFIKDPRVLYRGREVSNFRQRPREILANWLICTAGNCEDGPDAWTFCLDPMGGDGVIVKRSTGVGWPTEHVFIPAPKAMPVESIEDLIVDAVAHKRQKGEAYARGKQLVVFADVKGGPWRPNQAGKRIEGQHGFESVWAVGLEQTDGNEYLYWVVRFEELNSHVWKISVDIEAIEWSVERIQQL